MKPDVDSYERPTDTLSDAAKMFVLLSEIRHCINDDNLMAAQRKIVSVETILKSSAEAAASARLRASLQQLYERISNGHKQSIGSIDNVRMVQFSMDEVNELAAVLAGQGPAPQPEPTEDYVSILREAKKIVEASPIRRFMDHTPLYNDVPVWMADFALRIVREHAAYIRASIVDAELDTARQRLEQAHKLQRLTEDNEVRWMQKHEAAEAASARLRAACQQTLRIAVLGILDNAAAYQWSVQGFGLLRLYIRDVGRLHIWDSALRAPNVSMVHNHSWDLHSTVIAGRLVNTRYKLVEGYGGDLYHGRRLVTGYHTRTVSALDDIQLAGIGETYGPGDTYSQLANEIHRTDADDGTVTLMLRQEDENGQADVYWPAGTEWGTAKPRAATPEEVSATVTKALAAVLAGQPEAE